MSGRPKVRNAPGRTGRAGGGMTGGVGHHQPGRVGLEVPVMLEAVLLELLVGFQEVVET